jgi:hypothetical protein
MSILSHPTFYLALFHCKDEDFREIFQFEDLIDKGVLSIRSLPQMFQTHPTRHLLMSLLETRLPFKKDFLSLVLLRESSSPLSRIMFSTRIMFYTTISLLFSTLSFTLVAAASGCQEEMPLNDPLCAAVLCPAGSVCVKDPKQCFTEPCPQVRCQPLDEPCVLSGCSNEICGFEELLSPCVFDEKFKCLTEFATCKRALNGTCHWHYDDCYEAKCTVLLSEQ